VKSKVKKGPGSFLSFRVFGFSISPKFPANLSAMFHWHPSPFLQFPPRVGSALGQTWPMLMLGEGADMQVGNACVRPRDCFRLFFTPQTFHNGRHCRPPHELGAGNGEQGFTS
jgi:hypothetical protein